MFENQESSVREWIMEKENKIHIPTDWHCETRDVFQIRLERMTREFIRCNTIEAKAYIFSAIVGEIGNNSFDHNIGNWQDVPGVWFSFEIFSDGKIKIILADRGRGVLETLQYV